MSRNLYRSRGLGTVGIQTLVGPNDTLILRVQQKDIVAQVVLTVEEVRMLARELTDDANAIQGRLKTAQSTIEPSGQVSE